MTDEIKIKMTGDSSGLAGEFNRLHKAARQIVEDLTETAKAAKRYGENHGRALQETNVEMNRLHSAAERWKRQVESPASVHERNLKQLRALYRMGKLSLDEYTAAAKLSEQAMQSATSKGSAGLSDMLGKIGGAAAGFVGIGSAIGGMAAAAAIIKREYQNLLESQKTAADRQVDTATAQREALSNLGEDPTMSDDEFVQWAGETAKKSGASQKSVYQAASAVLSMKGDVDTRQALESVEVSAAMNPDDVGAIKENAAAQVNLMTRDKSLRAKDIAGQFLAAKQASPTVTDAAFARNIAPGIAQGMAFGDTARESAALRATIGTGIGDQEGAVTASAAINLEKQLAEIMPDVQGGTIARLKTLQTPEMADERHKLLGAFDDQKASTEKAGMTGEAKAFTTLIELLKGEGTRATELLAANLEKIPETAGSGKYVDELQARLMQQPLQQNAAVNRQIQSSVDALQLGNLEGGQRSISREGLTETLKAGGYSKTAQDLALAEFEVATLAGGANPAEQLGKQLQRKARERLATSETIQTTGVGFGSMAVMPTTVSRTPSAEDQRVGSELNALAAAMLKIAESQQQQNRLVEEQNVILRNGRTGPQPAGGPPAVVPTVKPDTTPPGRRPSADRQTRSIP